MRLSASIFYGLHRPSECELRLYLRAKGVEEAKESPYEEVLLQLGQRYESEHLRSIGAYADVSEGTEEERVQRTIELVRSGAPAVYQPAFRISVSIGGQSLVLTGEPDLLIKEDGGYRVRDVKISRRITEQDHPEILLQLGMYGWLFEQTFKQNPMRLEVLSGAGILEEVPSAAVARAIGELERIAIMLTGKADPVSPVGWTKCGGCGFKERCWNSAVRNKDVATVPGVDEGLARALYGEGITTIEGLLSHFDESTLAGYQRPWGARMQKVGKAAGKILRLARVIADGKERVLATPAIPAADNYVMFDLEGLPPQLDELDKIYLWGIQVFGARPSEYLGKIAMIGPNGDREGWEAFLESAQSVFDNYGDVPYVHWSHYEKTKLNAYIERYGDRDGIAQRVNRSLLDLLRVTQNAIELPLPSYSLKVIEQYIGFKRSQSEYGGDWAMAAFVHATEAEDEGKRRELLESILTYNREDLEATWAVLRWLKSKQAS